MIFINNILKNNYHIIINLVLLLIVYIGFYFDENITQGPKLDFEHALKQVESFSQNFNFTFFNYDKIENSTRISPIFTSFLYILNEITNDIGLTRFILLNILFLNQLYLFKCLKISKISKVFDKKILFTISSLIYLSPSFRANIIWPESAMLGLLFFQISLFYFLKFEKKNQFKYTLLNVFFLAIAAYIRPSFCLFAIYFFYKFFVHYYKKNFSVFPISTLIFFNIFLSLPAFYYVFILDIFFIESGGLSANYYNKISIIITIIFFHLIPVIFYFYNNFDFNLKKDFNLFLLISISLVLIVFNFNYNLELAGGGIILHLSNFIFNNNYFFFLFYSISLYFIIKLISFDKFNNFLLIIILILITPQYHIFHKYYDPLVLIISFTIFNFNLNSNFKNKFHFITLISSFYICLNLTHLINNFIN